MATPTGTLHIIAECPHNYQCANGQKCATKKHSDAEFKPHLSLAYAFRLPDGHAVFESRCRDFIERR